MHNHAPLPLKKIFLIALISFLSVTALIAIVIFIKGSFGELEAKTLLTTFAIGGYSLTSLCNIALWNKRRHPLAIFGIIFSILGLIATTIVIWHITEFNQPFRVFLLFAVLSISTAQTSLLLAMGWGDNKLVRIVLYTTITFIGIVTALLIYLIFRFDYIQENVFYRILGVFVVLDVLGTITTPILKKMD